MVQSVGLGDERNHGLAGPSHASTALPRCDLAARVSDQDAHVEPAHVDAHFEGGGRDHTEQLAGEQTLLDLAPLLGQEARPVRGDARGEGGLGFCDPGVHELGDDPRLRKGDRAQTEAHGQSKQPRGERVGRAVRAEEQHLASGTGSTARLHDLERAGGERGRELSRVRDGGRCRDELRPRAVEPRHSIEAPHHLGDVGAEDPAVGVEFVDRDQPQVAKEFLPAHVVGKDARVKHVGRRDQDVRRFGAQLLALGLGRVAVVDRDVELRARRA